MLIKTSIHRTRSNCITLLSLCTSSLLSSICITSYPLAAAGVLRASFKSPYFRSNCFNSKVAMDVVITNVLRYSCVPSSENLGATLCLFSWYNLRMITLTTNELQYLLIPYLFCKVNSKYLPCKQNIIQYISFSSSVFFLYVPSR